VSPLRPTRRDCIVIAIASLIAFAVAIPFSSATSSRAADQFTIWQGNEARFANLDWNCIYFANVKQIRCGRESTWGGVQIRVSGEKLTVWRCTPRVCPPPLLRVARNP
jgi:hypothetical protein